MNETCLPRVEEDTMYRTISVYRAILPRVVSVILVFSLSVS